MKSTDGIRWYRSATVVPIGWTARLSFDIRSKHSPVHAAAKRHRRRIAARLRAQLGTPRSARRKTGHSSFRTISLIQPKDRNLFIGDGQRAERIPSGTELQKLFDAITVTDADTISEAGFGYKSGDAIPPTPINR